MTNNVLTGTLRPTHSLKLKCVFAIYKSVLKLGMALSMKIWDLI